MRTMPPGGLEFSPASSKMAVAIYAISVFVLQICLYMISVMELLRGNPAGFVVALAFAIGLEIYNFYVD